MRSLPVRLLRLLAGGLDPLPFKEQFSIEVGDQLLDLVRREKLAEPLQVQRTDFGQ